MGIKETCTTAYHPQCDALVERHNCTIQGVPSSFDIDHGNDLGDALDQAVFSYNTSIDKSATLSPYELVFGCEVHLPIEVDLDVPLRNPSYQSKYSQCRPIDS